MNNYTIYCTESQTKKALELGAPIDFRNGDRPYISIPYYDEDNRLFYRNYDLPTTEQMINWLEDTSMRKVKIDSFSHEDYEGCYDEWFYTIFDKNNNNIRYSYSFKSRKGATLAAIDAALDYLISKKGE